MYIIRLKNLKMNNNDNNMGLKIGQVSYNNNG